MAKLAKIQGNPLKLEQCLKHRHAGRVEWIDVYKLTDVTYNTDKGHREMYVNSK